MMAVLQTIDLKKYYGEGENQVKALDGICLEIEEGNSLRLSELLEAENLHFYICSEDWIHQHTEE